MMHCLRQNPPEADYAKQAKGVIMKKSLKTKNWKIDTLTVHAGITENEYGAVVPPIYQVSTFRFKDVDQGVAIFSGT